MCNNNNPCGIAGVRSSTIVTVVSTITFWTGEGLQLAGIFYTIQEQSQDTASVPMFLLRLFYAFWITECLLCCKDLTIPPAMQIRWDSETNTNKLYNNRSSRSPKATTPVLGQLTAEAYQGYGQPVWPSTSCCHLQSFRDPNTHGPYGVRLVLLLQCWTPLKLIQNVQVNDHTKVQPRRHKNT